MIIKRLSTDAIVGSEKIGNWLSQFDSSDRKIAESLLSHLQFIGRDDYSEWLLRKLSSYNQLGSVAVFAVRKFRKTAVSLWNTTGVTQRRPASTQGSEDLVASVISNAIRIPNSGFLDHPSLSVMKQNRTRHVVLIEDSIGSGKRVSDFVQLMMNNKTFMSWWSGGYITLHILSYARTQESSRRILKDISGSDHGARKKRVSEKVVFDSEMVYDSLNLSHRWGPAAISIVSLCNRIKRIPRDRRQGFGGVMSNLVFYHSVPNNIPGLLHSSPQNWKPLFPNRKVPAWMIKILEGESIRPSEYYRRQRQERTLEILKLIKRGQRTYASIAKALDVDVSIIKFLLELAIQEGFVTTQHRITATGVDYLHRGLGSPSGSPYNFGLYIPRSWCAD